jgi:exosome complex component RRP42
MAASSSKSEQAYIRTSLQANPPLRLDGRSLEDFRPIALETSVVDLANGSARVCIGGESYDRRKGDQLDRARLFW